MSMLEEFVIENAEIIDNLEWRKLADNIYMKVQWSSGS